MTISATRDRMIHTQCLAVAVRDASRRRRKRAVGMRRPAATERRLSPVEQLYATDELLNRVRLARSQRAEARAQRLRAIEVRRAGKR